MCEISNFKLLTKHYSLSLPNDFPKSSSIYRGSESYKIAKLNLRRFCLPGRIFPSQPCPFTPHNKSARKCDGEMSSFVDEEYSVKHDKKISMDFPFLSQLNLNIQYTMFFEVLK